jgi:hypothetical protein
VEVTATEGGSAAVIEAGAEAAEAMVTEAGAGAAAEIKGRSHFDTTSSAAQLRRAGHVHRIILHRRCPWSLPLG